MEQMDKTKICVGIDLGTTNTSAAYSRLTTDGQIEIVDLDILQKGRGAKSQPELLPSILYQKSATEDVVGNEAKDLKEESISAADSEVRYLENTKLCMGTRTPLPLGGKTYTPIDVASMLLSHVKHYSNIKRMNGDYYTIITVPANFNTDQREDTLEAARRAGFSNVELYDEPKAAILSFLHAESRKREGRMLDVTSKKTILVIDIGGGTCDICVEDVEEKDGQYIFYHRAVGRENLGGADFDKRIGDALAQKTLKGITLTKSESASIRAIGEKVKMDISDEIDYFAYSCNAGDGYEIPLHETRDWLDVFAEENYICSLSLNIRGKTETFSMDVYEFFDAIKPLIYNVSGSKAVNKTERDRRKNIQSLIEDTLSEKNIDIDTVDLIFLTGGMAKCFPLRAALFELYGKPIISPDKPFLAVSRGAALVNKYPNVDAEASDIMPNAILIEMADGHLKPLVNMGQKVPVTDIKVPGTFRTSSQNGVVIRLFEGKNEFDSQLRRINNRYAIKFSEPKELDREFEIGYSVDKTKRIQFTITFLDTGERYEIASQTEEGK